MKELFRLNVDCVLIIHQKERPDSFFRYLSKINADFGIAYITKRKKEFFVSPLETKNHKHTKPFSKNTIQEILKRKRRIGINKEKISVATLEKLKKYAKKAKFVDISKKAMEIQSIKTTKEIELIKKASRITEEILKKCIQKFKSFKTEKEAATFLKIETIKHNCKLAFEPIVASGKNAKTPHHIPTNKKIQKGFCIIDFGVKYQGYCADMTRTIYVGTPSKKEIEIYNIIKKSLELEKEIKPNMTGKQIIKLYHKKNNLQLIHALGHGIGLEVHEKPLIAETKDRVCIGNVITLEPATYETYGIRIENMYYITKKGLSKISKLPIELLKI